MFTSFRIKDTQFRIKDTQRVPRLDSAQIDIDRAFQRRRPPTQENINQLLGISDYDSYFSKNSGYFSECQQSHCHPYATTPIRELSWYQFFCIVVNYDNDRNRSKHYTLRDNDEINFFLEELAYRGLCILIEGDVPENDLTRVIHSISTSKYLASHGIMHALLAFASKVFGDKNYLDGMRSEMNLEAKHAAWEQAFKFSKKVSPAIDALHNEIYKFSLGGTHVKHGMYAGKKTLPHRELFAVLKQISEESITIGKGLDKMMELARDHQPLFNAVKKVRNLAVSSHHGEVLVKQRFGL